MRSTLSQMTLRSAAAAVLLLALSAPGRAQLPNASPAAYGMSGNYTAMARGYEAVAWNPANLAMPGRPAISIGAMIIGGTVGMDPVDFKMLHSFSGVVVDSATKKSWVDLVRTSGRQRARIDGGLTPLALSVGPIGFQMGASTFMNFDVSPDAFEALMFGNAGLNGGQPKSLNLAGTGVETATISAAAVSFALPLPFHFTAGVLGSEHLAIGITGKYVLGNALLIARDGGSVLGASSLAYSFPTIGPKGLDSTDTYDPAVGLGTGTGADLSAAWSAGRWRVGALLENVFNSFKWDTTKLAYSTGSGYFDKDTSYSNTGEKPYGQAPAALRSQIAGQKFTPALNIGVAFNATDFLTITADLHQQTGGDNAISIGPKNRMGVGAELRIIPIIRLRGGVASVTDGWQAGAGLGVHLLGLELGVSGSLRRRGAANEAGVMFGLVGIGH